MIKYEKYELALPWEIWNRYFEDYINKKNIFYLKSVLISHSVHMLILEETRDV